MMRLSRAFFLLIVLVSLPAASSAVAAPAAAEEGEEFSAVDHSADGYYLDFEPFGKIELPRILLVRGEGGAWGLDVFGSTAAALRSGRYEVLGAHGGDAAEQHTGDSHDGLSQGAASHAAAGTPAAAEQMIESGGHLHAEIAPVSGAVLVDFSISRHLVFAWLAALLVVFLFMSLARRYKRGVGRETAPRGLLQNAMETIIVFIRDEVAKPTLGEHYRKFLPYLLSIFFFVLTCNLLGLVPFGATATSNITVTAVLALFTFFITQINGSKDHWRHVFNPPGMPLLLKPIMVPIEIIGLFTKPFALAVRLFANMTAGHLVILSLIGLIFTFNNIFGATTASAVAPVSVAFALFIYLLEILVALIQAYIFAILSGLFIGMAVEQHEHGEEPSMGEGETPELHSTDHAEATPHLLGGDADGVEPIRRTDEVERQQPATAAG